MYKKICLSVVSSGNTLYKLKLTTSYATGRHRLISVIADRSPTTPDFSYSGSAGCVVKREHVLWDMLGGFSDKNGSG